MSKLLGLDISTSCIGVTILDTGFHEEDINQIVSLDHIKFKKLTLFEKSDQFRSYLEGISEENKIDHIYIEDAAKKFQSGRSSASVIATLMRFNGIASYIAWDVLKQPINYVAPSHARKLIGLKMMPTKKCGRTHKQQTFDAIMNSDLSHITWPNKRRSTNIVDYAYDIVDSYVIAKAGRLIEQNKD